MARTHIFQHPFRNFYYIIVHSRSTFLQQDNTNRPIFKHISITCAGVRSMNTSGAPAGGGAARPTRGKSPCRHFAVRFQSNTRQHVALRSTAHFRHGVASLSARRARPAAPLRGTAKPFISHRNPTHYVNSQKIVKVSGSRLHEKFSCMSTRSPWAGRHGPCRRKPRNDAPASLHAAVVQDAAKRCRRQRGAARWKCPLPWRLRQPGSGKGRWRRPARGARSGCPGSGRTEGRKTAGRYGNAAHSAGGGGAARLTPPPPTRPPARVLPGSAGPASDGGTP